MTAPTPDAVAQAREAVFAQMKTLASPSFDAAKLAQAFQRYENALSAAVRAECADRYESALTAVSKSGGVGRVIVERIRKYITEAQP